MALSKIVEWRLERAAPGFSVDVSREVTGRPTVRSSQRQRRKGATNESGTFERQPKGGVMRLIGIPAVVLAVVLPAFLVLTIVGVGTSDPTRPPFAEAGAMPQSADVTFYVVGFHWGWAVFDENGAELDGVRVPEGTTVELYAVNPHAKEAVNRLPAPVAAAISANAWDGERVRDEVAVGRLPDPQELIGMSLEEVLAAGHDDGDVHDDETAEGDVHDDEAAEGDAHDDEAAEGDAHDDEATEGDAHDDEATEGDAHDDEATEGDAHDDEATEGDVNDDEAAEGDVHDDEAAEGDAHDDEASSADAHDDEAAEGDAHDDEASSADAMVGHAMPWLGEERELETHGFVIPWYGVAEKLEPDATEPVRVIFIADRVGTFDFVCTVYCGWGHQYQPREMLFVEAA
jgi:hypothetical protein